ncbi:MAG: hypothetical protein ABJB09_05690 [Verrucomicrobiota bacterium]
MRALVAFLTLLSGIAAAAAQEQENKLMDRLLRPDMEMANPAQQKKFMADGAAVDKRARTNSFYTPEKSLGKTFPAKRSFLSRIFATNRSRVADTTANLSTRSSLTNAHTAYVTPNAYPTRAAAGGERSAPGKDFSGNRSFLDQGKSQKSLDHHEAPMTIDQVRELLNKNK